MKLKWLLQLLIFLIGFDFSCTSVGAAAVSQWSVYELDLTSQGTYSNPYTQVTLTATFSGPNNTQKTVKGFWDGGNHFKVRFTPTAVGSWTYTTTASPADTGLAQTGSLTVTVPQSGDHGFIRRDPTHPYYWQYDDHSRYWMLGTTYYGLIANALAGTKWKTSLNNLPTYGINKVRLLLYTWPQTAYNYPDVEPFKANHDTLNLTYWQQFDQIIQYMASQHLVADVVLFTDADRAYGTQVQDERYLRYALARYAAYPSVIWCLTNEWNYTPKSQSYWNTLGTLVKAEDPWLSQDGALRPLSIHQQTRADFQFFGSSWPTHAIVQFGIRSGVSHADAWGNQSIVSNRTHNMPVVNDEWGYMNDKGEVTRTEHRQIAWGVYTGGGSGSTGDGYGDTKAPFWTGDWVYREEYADLKILKDFWTQPGLDYWKMSPQNQMITSGTRVYALGETGKAYVVYAAVGGTIKLTLPTGSYQVTRLNPSDGTTSTLPSLAGGNQSVTLPSNTDSVLSIKALTTPSPTPISFCPADVVPDHRINLQDLLYVLSHWAELKGIQSLLLVLNQWDQPC